MKNRYSQKITIKLSTLLLCSLIVAACTSNSTTNKEKVKINSVSQSKVVEKPRTVHIYFFGDFPQELGKETINSLSEVYPSVKFEGNIPLPDSAYYKPRNRYLALKLLSTMMSLQKNGDRVLGFTTKDISLKYKEHENWGVMGLSYLNRRACVISTFRLKNAAKLKEHFKKLMFHEIGHVEGLPHCKFSQTCIMRDANGKNHFSELNDFCPKCKKYLQEKGWLLN